MTTHHTERAVTRVWRVRIEPSRVADYARFVAERSLPMFRSLPGLSSALFLATGEERVVVSTWESQDAVDALAANDAYRSTVAALEASGILASEQSLELLQLEHVIAR